MGNLLNHLCGQPCTLIIASAQSKVKRALLMLGRSGADEATDMVQEFLCRGTLPRNRPDSKGTEPLRTVRRA